MTREEKSAVVPRYLRYVHPICAARFVASLFFLFLASCAAQPLAADVGKIDCVLSLIQQRLGYMDDVARNKWNSKAPIEDLPREREIIDAIGRTAPAYGLDPQIAKDFFRAQIDASKIVQNARFAEWRARNQPRFTDIPNLQDRIRPALDALTPALMLALADAVPIMESIAPEWLDERAQSVITGSSMIDAARVEAVAPFKRMAGKGRPRR